MTVFVVLTPTDRADAAIQTTFPGEFLKVAGGQWLVAAGGMTTQEITGRLGAETGDKGQVIVLAVSSYWGWHTNNIWEWIRTKMAL